MANRAARYSVDWRLFVPAAIIMGVIVVVGFGPSYFYRPFTRASDSLTGLVHLHGALMTLWMTLFMTQVVLVASGRTDLHRRLGKLGFVVLGLIVAVSVPMTLVAAHLGGHHMPGPPLVALGLVSSILAAFVILAGAGLYFTHRSDIHKRLMLLASAAAVEAGVLRLPLDFLDGMVSAHEVTDAFLLIFIAIDSIRHRRLNPAFLWGMTFLMGVQGLSVWISGTAWWGQAMQGLLRQIFH